MAVIGTSAFSGILKPDLWSVFVRTGREKPLEYTSYFNVRDMPWNPIDDRAVAGLGTLQSMDEGEQFPLDEPVQQSTVTATAEIFGLGLEITYPMWRDDQYGVMRTMVAELARSSRNKQEVEAWSVLNNAFDTSFTGFDSLSLCNTSHTLETGGTTANRPSPDVGFSTLAVQNSLIRFENMVDERGLPRLLTPSMVLVAPENRFVVREVLGSAGKPFTADNEMNSLIQDDLRWMIVHYFTDTAQWFLSAAQGEHDLEFLWRDRPIFDLFDEPRSKNAIATVWQRHTKRFKEWRGVDGSSSNQ